MIKTRIIKNHLQYIQRVLQGPNELVKRVINVQLETQKSKCAKITNKYLKQTRLSINALEVMKKEEAVKHIRKWDQDLRQKQVSEKTSLEVYQKTKQTMKEDNVYDNQPT